LRPLAFNHIFYEQAYSYLHHRSLSFIYQRYSANNFAGVKLARTLRVPFIIEYNGSELWVHRHWGKPLPHEALAEQIELANLRGAHVVVVVSQALKDELVVRGIEAAKILVNPNGVDPERYSPTVDGGEVRRRYGLVDKIVVGFIGTFGHWHGTEVLADAFGALLAQHPQYRSKVHLLLIGDGVRMPQVKENLAKHGIAEQVTLAGVVPQTEGPRYLAACDILASPHVPNPDGSVFFGSPTKLFEYMAMGKGIVASDLAQIGEILRHNKTAWLVKPGDEQALRQGLKALIEDAALRSRLGENARQTVVANYTWRAHTQRIIEKLGERCA
jgi:glycosyltransferase involved in cell wall biosynthesis